MAGRLNDNEVAQEMNKMVAFIKQEALEKAREIKVKADEEFNIEKGKLVRQESVAIEAFFQKKLKQAEQQKKIAQSNMINKNRLKVLASRQQVLTELFSESKSRLPKITSDTSAYKKLLKNLILQALYQLMETNVTIQSRASDFDLVSSVLDDAKSTFVSQLGGKLDLTLDKSSPLQDSCGGGVVVSAQEGRIRISNTLSSRLDLLQELMLPEIRTMLFGPSPNRKFYN